MGIKCRPLGNITFFAKMTRFSCRCSNWLQITKNNFLHFLAFYPLVRRFTLSGVVHVKELDEIYRSVSKNLNFMASGSIFENLSKINRKSIENLLKIYRKSIENRSKIYRKAYRKSIENRSKTYRKSIENLSKIYRTPI